MIGIWGISSSRKDPFSAVQGHPRSIVCSNWSIPIERLLLLLLSRPVTIHLMKSLWSVSVNLLLLLTRPYPPVTLLSHVSIMHFLCRILRIISRLLLRRVFISTSVSVSPIFAFLSFVSNFAAN
jgi:hypothetical protein